MKIIADINPILKSSGPHKPGSGVLVWPDSVMVRSGKPVFIPSEDEEFNIFEGFCVKINRLGKSIDPRFANQYFAEAAPIAFIANADTTASLLNGVCPDADKIMFDSCLIVGDFTPLPEELTDEAADAIVNSSRYLTLKIGDLIVHFSKEKSPSKAIINKRYEYALTPFPRGEATLKFKVK